jgi:uncharacterized membrane protein
VTWARRFRRREAMRQSLWLVPLGGAVAGALLAWAAASVGDAADMPAGLTFTPSTASAVLSAILGAMIGLVGFVVTVTVLLVQTSTGQFSARYMRLLYRDRLLKLVLAVLLGTFAYSFVLLRRVGETEAPDLGLIVVGGLVLLGVVLFLVFLSRILQRLRPVAVAATVGALGTRAFVGLAEPVPAGVAPPGCRHGTVHVVVSTRAGTVQAVSHEGLVDWARRHSCTLVLREGVGDFVHVGSPLMEIRASSAPPPGSDGELEGLVALGRGRTVHQDPAFAVRLLVDIANRALSAAVNDPTTATQVLDYVEDLLLVVGRCDFSGRGVLRDRDGVPLVVLPARGWDDYLALGVTEIRESGGGSVPVARRLRALLLRLRDGVLPEHRAAVDDELARLEATVRRRFEGSADLDRALGADTQGLGGPARPSV